MHVGSKHSCHRSAAVAPRLALTGVKGWMQPCLFLCPFLLLRVALTLRSLRIHTPRLCRFAVLYYKPTFLPHQGVAKRLITNRIRQTVALGLISTRPCYWVPSKSRFGLFLALFLARSKNRQEQTKSVFLA